MLLGLVFLCCCSQRWFDKSRLLEACGWQQRVTTARSAFGSAATGRKSREGAEEGSASAGRLLTLPVIALKRI